MESMEARMVNCMRETTIMWHCMPFRDTLPQVIPISIFTLIDKLENPCERGTGSCKKFGGRLCDSTVVDTNRLHGWHGSGRCISGAGI